MNDQRVWYRHPDRYCPRINQVTSRLEDFLVGVQISTFRLNAQVSSLSTKGCRPKLPQSKKFSRRTSARRTQDSRHRMHQVNVERHIRISSAYPKSNESKGTVI